MPVLKGELDPIERNLLNKVIVCRGLQGNRVRQFYYVPHLLVVGLLEQTVYDCHANFLHVLSVLVLEENLDLES